MLGQKRSKSVYFIIFAVLFSICSSMPLMGGEAAEILQAAREKYENSVVGIDDYVVVTEDITVYHKKVWRDDEFYFRSRIEAEEASEFDVPSVTSDQDIFGSEIYQTASEKAVYGGKKELDGKNVHLIKIDEISDFPDQFEIGRTVDEDVEEYTIKNMKLYIDEEELLLRKIDFTVIFHAKGSERELEMEIRHEDYRDIEGLLIPYKTVSLVKGLSGALTEEERKQAEEGIREMEKRLEQMPPEQRAMAEQMMGGQIEQFKQVLEKDQIEQVMQIDEVKVNVGVEEF